jgi:hypothetical protein
VNTSPDPAAPSAPAAVPKKGFYQGPWPFVVATGGEFVGLFFWLAYFDAGQYVLATIVLWAGFLTERYVVLNWTAAFRGLLAAEYPAAPHYDSFQAMSPVQKLAKLLIITVTEISIWVTAVLVFDHVNWVAAFAVLILGEQLQHSWELGLIASRPITDYIPTWKALTITLLETVGGIIWIALVRHQQPQLGGLFILIGLSIEHVVQSKKIQVDLAAQVEQQAKAAAGTSEAVPVPAAAGTAGAVGASA